LALFVVSCWLLQKRKVLRFTIIPAIFMLITTVTALVYQSISYFKSKDYLLFIISYILVGLSLFMLIEILRLFFQKKLERYV
jgi:carbon starvation protein